MSTQPNKLVVLIVLCSQAIMAMGCVASLCISLFYKVYADPSILSAMILLTGTLVGNLSSILGGPRQMQVTPPDPPPPPAQP